MAALPGGWPRPGTGALCLLVVLVGVVVLLLARGTASSDLVRYSLFLLVGVVAPGLVLHKGLRGTQGSWLSDVSLGAATGAVMTLVAWAVAGALSAWPLMWCWPVLAFALLLSPTVRARVRQRPQAGSFGRSHMRRGWGSARSPGPGARPWR